MLTVEVARGGRNNYGHRMGGWKVMTGGIPVARMATAKDARRYAKNLRKLYSSSKLDAASAAAFFAVGQLKDDHDLWQEDDPYRGQYEEDFREPVEEEMA